MANLVGKILWKIYSAILPHLVSEKARMEEEPDPWPISCRLGDTMQNFHSRHPTFARIHAHIWLSYYLPIFHPIRWWRQTRAYLALLQMIEEENSASLPAAPSDRMMEEENH